MSQLNNSKVYRGGITTLKTRLETKDISASVNPRDESLDIKFNLASKGGGTTHVILEIGKADFQTILQEIASKLPESIGVLTDCASIANKKNLEQLQEARKAHNGEKERINKLIEELEIVEKFVSEKYFDAPIDQDEKEKLARDKLLEVINILRQPR